MTPDEIVAAIAAEGGFDTSNAESSAAVILSWANDARAEAIVDAKWRRSVVSLGPTVAAQSQYALPSGVVDLRSIRVNSGRRWKHVSWEELWDLQAGGGTVVGAPGAFAAASESDTDAVVELWPTPAEAGFAIEGIAATEPDAMVAGGTEASVGLPKHLHRRICVHGGIAEGKLLVNEDAATANFHKAIWREAGEKLKRMANSRVGSGPSEARMYR